MSGERSDKNVLILYVEDDVLTHQSVTERFARSGFRVLEAESGEQALELLRAGTVPAAALLDLELPGIDGVKKHRLLKEISPDLPAVVCSGALTPYLRRRLREIGIPEECLLIKPCSFQTILGAIEGVI